MDRRTFLKTLAAAAAAPAIGLPAVAPAAPAVAFTYTELAKIAEECLIELEEKEPFRSYFTIKLWPGYFLDLRGTGPSIHTYTTITNA